MSVQNRAATISPFKQDDELVKLIEESFGNGEKNNKEVPVDNNSQRNPPSKEEPKTPVKPVGGIRRNYLDTKNPYSNESKIDLDEEWKKGFRQIGTSVVLSLISAGLTGNEWSLYMYLHHRTWGFCNKKNGFKHVESEIPIREILEKTRIPRTTIHRSLEGLEARKMIYRVTDKKTNREKIGVNLRFDTWSNLS
jgi:DNA-binding MarR family transcriptional regulator